MAATNTVDAQSGEWTTFNGAPVFHLQGTASSAPTHWQFTTASGIVGIELRIVALHISCGGGVGGNCVWDAYLSFTNVPPGTYKILVKAFFPGGTAQDIYPEIGRAHV